MPSDTLVVIAVTLVALALFISERLPVDLVALLLLVVLVFTGLVTPDEALAGFANPAVITVACMFVLSAGLIRTGALDVVTRAVLTAGGASKRRQLALLVLTVATISAFMNNTPVTIVFLPVFLDFANRHGTVPSRLLIPLSFATILGGTCTVIGTSTNLLVSQAAEKAGLPPIGMFDFAVPGMLYAVAGLAFLGLAGPRLLPRRASVASVRADGRGREYVTEVCFPAGSPLVGTSFQTLLASFPAVTPLMVLRGEETFLAPLVSNPRTQIIRAEDRLLLRGGATAIGSVLEREGVELPPELSAELVAHRGRTVTLVELVIVPHSPLVGRTLGGYGFSRRHAGASALAVLRRDEHIRERIVDLRLRMGDTLLVLVDEAQLAELRASEEFILLEGVERERVRHDRAPLAAAILAAVVALAATDVLPIATLALAGSVAMVLTGCLPLRRAYDAIDLSILVLIVGMLALARALEKTGVLAAASETVASVLQPWGPRAVFAGLFLLSTLTTSIASNNAVAVLMTPIALGVAAQMGLAPAPFLFAVLFGASCDFSTPIGYQTNLFVYGPGGYRFRDYMRIGIPLTAVLFVVTMIVVPWWFPFVPAA